MQNVYIVHCENKLDTDTYKVFTNKKDAEYYAKNLKFVIGESIHTDIKIIKEKLYDSENKLDMTEIINTVPIIIASINTENNLLVHISIMNRDLMKQNYGNIVDLDNPNFEGKAVIEDPNINGNDLPFIKINMLFPRLNAEETYNNYMKRAKKAVMELYAKYKKINYKGE